MDIAIKIFRFIDVFLAKPFIYLSYYYPFILLAPIFIVALYFFIKSKGLRFFLFIWRVVASFYLIGIIVIIFHFLIFLVTGQSSTLPGGLSSLESLIALFTKIIFETFALPKPFQFIVSSPHSEFVFDVMSVTLGFLIGTLGIIASFKSGLRWAGALCLTSFFVCVLWIYWNIFYTIENTLLGNFLACSILIISSASILRITRANQKVK